PDSAKTKIYPLSLHDALPIYFGPSTALGVGLTDTLSSGVLTGTLRNTRGTCLNAPLITCNLGALLPRARTVLSVTVNVKPDTREDRKSTRLNSSHRTISYAVF